MTYSILISLQICSKIYKIIKSKITQHKILKIDSFHRLIFALLELLTCCSEKVKECGDTFSLQVKGLTYNAKLKKKPTIDYT